MTLRSFPSGIRNCYTLRSLTIGSKYFVRAAFMYGNYDNLNKLPIFDIHLGPNWDTVRTSTYEIYLTEIIVMTTSDYLQGTPFISALELRPLETSIYKDANSTQSLVSYHRLNLGANDYLRYPYDPYDRFWDNFTLDTWTNISTSSTVSPDTEYATPSLVMQTAATTLNTKQSLDLPPWTSKNETDIPRTFFREFDIFVNGDLAFNSIVPSKLHSGFTKCTHTGNTIYNVSLKATSNSTLPPLLNAFEIYAIKPTRVGDNPLVPLKLSVLLDIKPLTKLDVERSVASLSH
ncbi:LRR receptor-like serine/threonine-protein kinase MEE39 [Carex littledalei]|uniref:LRR receptor-like serine/threonine-protein kinase MEE39 n=1 Tax=Carex littledalei TaxID=544730 RepID=A0A833V9J6_9POAL|nr:LRR receptor-like serine/threonine-protein kinase MEE39 [Carex littledalei]